MGQIGVDGDALHAVFPDDLLDLAHGGHLLVGVDAPEAHELIGIGAAEFEHAVVVGRETVGGLGVAAGDDAQFHAHGVEVGHDLVQGLGLALVEADDLTGGLEHGAVLDAVDDLRRVGPEAEVDNVHICLHAILREEGVIDAGTGAFVLLAADPPVNSGPCDFFPLQETCQNNFLIIQ